MKRNKKKEKMVSKKHNFTLYLLFLSMGSILMSLKTHQQEKESLLQGQRPQ